MPVTAAAPRPLEGLVVLDFSQYVAGPLATMLLSDLGADVIKVERPGGEAYRHYDPVAEGQSRYFCSMNRGKRSVVCDLADDTGAMLARDLIRHADAMVHNFLPRQAAAFGLDPVSLEELNPGLVVCAISALGTVGPAAGTPGYDLIAQANSGVLALTWRQGQEVPERLGGVPLTDIATGLLATIAVLSGLLERERQPGGGSGRPSSRDFEVSLLGASLVLQAQELAAEASEQPTQSLDRAELDRLAVARAAASSLDPYYRCYETADTFIAVACLHVAQRRRLLEALGARDPFVENPQRPPAGDDERRVREALVGDIARRFRSQSASVWLERLAQVSVPATEVRATAAASRSEQAKMNGLVVQLDQPGLGATGLLGGVIKRGGEPLVTARPAPSTGEHQQELEELAGGRSPAGESAVR
jgi:crotonobetainyl-CoA:carnitine CoA-transferase CaiB-like acyl-CoA transferase